MVKGFDGPRVYKGMLEGIDAGMISLNDTKSGAATLPFDQIHAAKLVLTDALIAATQPLDTSGADELIEDHEEKADD